MDWIVSSMDGNGVKTLYPPPPTNIEMIPVCDFCNCKTQFLIFPGVEILRRLKPDDVVPKLCSVICRNRYLGILKKHKESNMDENTITELLKLQFTDEPAVCDKCKERCRQVEKEVYGPCRPNDNKTE